MELELAFDLKFEDLQTPSGIKKLDGVFLHFLHSKSALLSHRLVDYRLNKISDDKEISILLIEVAKYLELFITELFSIDDNLDYDNARLIATCKRNFVQRIALKKYKSADDVGEFDIAKFKAKFVSDNFILEFVENVNKATNDELGDYEKYAALAHYLKLESHFLFKTPKKYQNGDYLDFHYDLETNEITSAHLRSRYGFSLTDLGGTLDDAIDQANYCIYCHNQLKDSCSTGLRDNQNNFKISETEVTLTGCPLDEKISEMNYLKYNGYTLGSFAMAIIDNPMIAATGHRICNDCMKSCIYQKQEPVNIPEIETRVLKDVLNLPWGFEIYNLLTIWNPLSKENYLLSESTGNKILIVGLGPAGFTLAHYLSKKGHEIVAIDGLKIEPFDSELLKPIYDINTVFEDLNDRIADGFGGVMEYGITNRWNKNYLKLIRIILERRKNITIQGGIRFGSNITPDQAKEMGFDHIAICCGAGKPNILDIKNTLARGVRTASDFLMSLHLSGAVKKDSISNLQIRLPIIVIGGGLTAIDTATEALAYYPVQVEKFLKRYELLEGKLNLDDEEQKIADEFISHAKLIRKEQQKPNPNIPALLNKFGGVKILYRKSIKESPAYRNNHEEVEKALEEGIRIIDNITPMEILVDKYHHIEMIKTKFQEQEIDFPVRTLLIAAGTSPNITLSQEFPGQFKIDGKYFQMIDSNGIKVTPERNSKPSNKYCLTHIEDNGFSISYLGDTHPSYAGNVVKAMASAKNSYKIISGILPVKKTQDDHFQEYIRSCFEAKIHAINILTSNIVELVVYAPLAAKNFRPGQFFKLQNYAKNQIASGLAMEPMAMTGASINLELGLISLIILEMGGSSSLCRYLSVGEEIILMGPTGKPTEFEAGENVILVGGGLGNAVLFSIGQAIRKKGGKILYFAGYKSESDIFKINEIEAAADVIVWCCDTTYISKTRDSDYTFKGNIVEALAEYSTILEEQFAKTSRVIVIGSDRMMNAVNIVLKGSIGNKLAKNCQIIASINSPMQCMMKEICAQCLQKHVDPETGIDSYVYSCVNQDQCMKFVDFEHLSSRLRQNSLSEKLTSKWIEYILSSK